MAAAEMAATVLGRPRFEITEVDRLRTRRRNTPIRTRYFPGDLAVERFLVELGRYRARLRRRSQLSGGWLLAFREDFRLIRAYRPCAGLREFLGVCPPEHPAFLVGVWLLGRCATRQSAFDLDRLPADGTPQARRHFAHALRRVESWPRLRRLAAQHSNDDAVRTILARPQLPDFARRMERFAVHVDKSHAAEAAVASQMALWIRDANWHRCEPKRPSWIRVVLERIKQWVRGESTT